MILSAKNLTKKYNGFVALNQVEIGVEAGQTKAVIGPNGAGKTTLFNVLSGILPPTSGEVNLMGDDITDEPLHRIVQRGLAKTFQTTNIFEEITAYENVRIAAQAKTTTYDMFSQAEDLIDVRERAEEILDLIGLTEQSQTLVENFSHGDQRKLEIGIALATDPDLLLLDEPTAGMSPEETDEALNLLQTLASDKEVTILLTEHDIDLVLDLADEIAVLHQGEIIAEEDPATITNNEEVQRVYLGG